MRKPCRLYFEQTASCSSRICQLALVLCGHANPLSLQCGDASLFTPFKIHEVVFCQRCPTEGVLDRVLRYILGENLEVLAGRGTLKIFIVVMSLVINFVQQNGAK